jgi:hypothetical protein
MTDAVSTGRMGVRQRARAQAKALVQALHWRMCPPAVRDDALVRAARDVVDHACGITDRGNGHASSFGGTAYAVVATERLVALRAAVDARSREGTR